MRHYLGACVYTLERWIVSLTFDTGIRHKYVFYISFFYVLCYWNRLFLLYISLMTTGMGIRIDRIAGFVLYQGTDLNVRVTFPNTVKYVAVQFSGVEVTVVSMFKRLLVIIKGIYCGFRKLAGITDHKF